MKDTRRAEVLARTGRVRVVRKGGPGSMLQLWWTPTGARNQRKRSAGTRLLSEAVQLAEAFDAQLGNGAIVEPVRKEAVRTTSREDVFALFERHPRTIIARASSDPKRQENLRYEEAALLRWCTFAGGRGPQRITVHRAMQWAEHLRKEGRATSTIEKHLRPLRKASKMAGDDALGGLPLFEVKPSDSKGVDFLALDDVIVALHALEDQARSAFALMVTCSLNSSELGRLRVCDLDGSFLDVGATKAKTSTRCRRLLLPPTLAGLLAVQADGRDGDAPLFVNSQGKVVGKRTVWEWVQGFGNPQKLRHTFRTLSEDEHRGSVDCIRYYMGHASGHTPLELKHYKGKLRDEGIRRLCGKLSKAWDGVLRAPLPQSGARK